MESALKYKKGVLTMELTQVKQRKEQLEQEVAVAQSEIDEFQLERAKLDQQSQILQEKIARREQNISSKRDEIQKLNTAIEVMER